MKKGTKTTVLGRMIYKFLLFASSVTYLNAFGLAPSRLTKPRTISNLRMSDDEYTIAILGDLHLDPRFMDDHIEGRKHFSTILEDGNKKNSCVVSLGDLGESKSVVEGSSELFAGTTGCFNLAREFLDGFKVPFEVVGGNHDLEGIDEFPTGSNSAYLHRYS